MDLNYIYQLQNSLRKLAGEHDIELHVISSKPFHLEGINVKNVIWSVDSEVASLSALDIGIMPLANDEWSAGKSGCKALQYMGVGLPVIVTPVGINADIIQRGKSGLACLYRR